MYDGCMHVPRFRIPSQARQLLERVTALLTDPRRLAIALVVLAMLLITSNVLFSRTFGFDRLLVTTAAYGTLGMVAYFLKLHAHDIGFGRNTLEQGLGWAIILALNIIAILTIVYVFVPSIFLDARYQQPLPDAMYAALVLLPLKTVLFEELAFRGVLWGR
jgi:uncharacterized protein